MLTRESTICTSRLDQQNYHSSSDTSRTSPGLLQAQMEWKRNENSHGELSSDSDKSFSTLEARSQRLENDRQLLETFDEEEYVDEDEDIDDEEEEDDDGDDEIIIDCEDDRDSLNDLEFSFSFFKQQMQKECGYLNKTIYSNSSYSTSPVFSLNTSVNSYQIDGPKPQIFSENCVCNADAKLNASHQQSTGTSLLSSCSMHNNEVGDGYSADGSQKEKRQLLDILKRKADIPTCTECGELILDRSLLKVEDRPWHSSCLKCKICRVPLTTSCFMRNEQTYCRHDFMKKFASKCAVCEQAIPSTEAVRRANENVYHLECFRCIACQEKLDTGDKFYLINGYKLMCKKDYEHQKSREVSIDSNSKRPRTSINAKQLETLKSAYNMSSKPARHVREQLSHDTGLEARVVQVWFQNRRAKEKRLNKETEQGKYSSFRNSTLSSTSLEHELNPNVINRRTSKCGSQNSRRRNAGLNGRIHHPRLCPTIPIQQNEMLLQPLTFGHMNDSLFTSSVLNSGTNPIALRGVTGPNDIPPLYPNSINDRGSSHTSVDELRPNVSLKNTPQHSFISVLSESHPTPLPGTPVTLPFYSVPDSLAINSSIVEDSAALSGIPRSKLDEVLLSDHAIKNVHSNPFSQPCASVFNTIDFFGNHFSTGLSQPKYGLDLISERNGLAVLTEPSSVSRPWPNDHVSNI